MTANNGNDNKKTKFQTMLKNPLFWPSVCMVVILSVLTAGFFININVSWLTVWAALTDEKTWAQVGIIVAGILGVIVLVNEKLKKMREKSDATAERVGLVEKTSELISRDNYDIKKFIDDLQEENKKYSRRLAETEDRLQEVRERDAANQTAILNLKQEILDLRSESKHDKKKIAALEAKIASLESQSLADKQEIVTLRARIISLEAELASYKVEHKRLTDENHELRVSFGRRSTDRLGPLPPEAEARLNDLEQQQ